jgi:hypothetical protein
MIRVRTTQRISLLFHFITLSFLLILVIPLALDGRITHAEPPIGIVLSHEKSLLVQAVVTHVCSLADIKLTRAIPATAMQGQASSACGVILDENGHILAIAEVLRIVTL